MIDFLGYTPAAVIEMLALASAAAFLLIRPSFTRAMMEARLSDMRWVSLELERLAVSGAIARGSSFYRYFKRISQATGSLTVEGVPSTLTWPLWLTLILREPHPEEASELAEEIALFDQAEQEMAGKYRQHAHLVRAYYRALIDLYSYKSIPAWLVLRAAVPIVGLIEIGHRLQDLFPSKPAPLLKTA